jgi:hypothetical protein
VTAATAKLINQGRAIQKLFHIPLSNTVAPNLEAYRRFQAEHLARVKAIRNMKTEIPMQQIKLSTELPLGPF